MSDVVLRYRAKATDREPDQLRWSLNWGFARHDEIRFTDFAIEFLHWIIPYELIDDAVLLVVPTLFFTADNIRVQSRDRTYHFQLKSPSIWGWQQEPFRVAEAPLPIRREFVRIG